MEHLKNPTLQLYFSKQIWYELCLGRKVTINLTTQNTSHNFLFLHPLKLLDILHPTGPLLEKSELLWTSYRFNILYLVFLKHCHTTIAQSYGALENQEILALEATTKSCETSQWIIIPNWISPSLETAPLFSE